MASRGLGRSAGWHGSCPELSLSFRRQREKVQMTIETDKKSRRDKTSRQSTPRQLIIQATKLSIFNKDSVMIGRSKNTRRTSDVDRWACLAEKRCPERSD